MTLVEELLRQKIDEVFLECQDKRHITSGDIEPSMSYHLDRLTETLAEHITKVLDFQTPQFNMTATLEVLEDFHCFKRGEIVFATDSTDTHYIIEKDIVLVYIPIDKCRKI